MATKILLVQGDTGPQLWLSIRDNDSALPLDMSAPGTKIVLKMREAGSDEISALVDCWPLPGILVGDPTSSLAAVDYTPPYDKPGRGGRCWTDWTAQSLAVDGDFEGEIEVTWTDGRVMTVYETLRFKIREQF